MFYPCFGLSGFVGMTKALVYNTLIYLYVKAHDKV